MALSKQDLSHQKETRLGQEKLNKQGCLMKIIDYNGVRNVTVQFIGEYRYETTTYYKHFLSGSIVNPYFPEVCGIGMRGCKYPTKVNGKNTKEYRAWYNMFLRCYDKRVHDKEPSYLNCEVCTEWYLYDNFYEWLKTQQNYTRWNCVDLCLDKDILFKGNKVYSPSTCCLVPKYINNLFVKSERNRGKLPIGVTYYKNNKKYGVNADGHYLGLFLTIQEAFNVYKDFKENLIKNTAEKEYKLQNITKQCYTAMLNYCVEITD